MKKLLVICGPTAVGKSSLAVTLAQKYNGEIISADSRQVYRELDVATGKITKNEMAGISHHLLDVADPSDDFSVADYKTLADQAIADIHKKNKLPILCGGSGFYIQAVVDDLLLPDVPPNETLRKKLKKRSSESLFRELKEKDSRRAAEIDAQNPVRLIRALEIIAELGKVPELQKQKRFDVLQICLDRPDKELKNRIIARTKERFEDGIIAEAEELYENGLSLERMRELGLEYEVLADYLEGGLTKQQLFKQIIKNDWQYARRQRTWFKKDGRIHWFHPKADKPEIIKVVKDLIEK
jgi:tRNA dimethylallyltransferase